MKNYRIHYFDEYINPEKFDFSKLEYACSVCGVDYDIVNYRQAFYSAFPIKDIGSIKKHL